MSRRWWVGVAWCALVAVAGFSSWLLLRNRAIPPAGTAAVQAPRPDYLLQQATLTRFAADGTRRYVISSPKIAHMPQTHATLLTPVQLDYFPAGTAPPWHLQADSGRLSEHDTRLDLTGHVLAHQLKTADPLRFTTREATVLLPGEQLSSRARVTLHQGHREMQGTGLAADLRAGTLSLLKDVTSRYVP